VSPVVAADGSSTYVGYETAEQEKLLVIIHFPQCISIQFGQPGDGTIAAHPLYGSGLEPGGAFIVERSEWMMALQKLEATHPDFDVTHWSRLRHYLLSFKDQLFECVSAEPLVYRFAADEGGLTSTRQALWRRLEEVMGKRTKG
jgi:hypothetical protein